MDCERYLESHDLLLDAESGRGTLPAHEVSALQAHRADCMSCRAAVLDTSAVAEWVRKTPKLQAPPGIGDLERSRWSVTRRRSWVRWAGVGLAAAAALLAVAAVFWPDAPEVVETPVERVEPVLIAPPPKDEPDCSGQMEALRRFLSMVPATIEAAGALQDDTRAREATKLLQEAADLGDECKDHGQTGEMAYSRAFLLYLLRTQAAAREDPEAYFRRAEIDARLAIAKLSKEDSMRPRAHRLLAWAQTSAGKFADAHATHAAFLKEWPFDKEANRVEAELVDAALRLRRYDEALRVIRARLREKEPTNQARNRLFELLWKLEQARGDFAGMEDVAREAMVSLQSRLAAVNVEPQLNDVMERSLDFWGFRRGYALFAQGENDRAQSAFEEHVRVLDEKEARLGSLRPESAIYRGRSRDNIDFLSGLAGRPVSRELELGDLWVTTERLTFARAKGKVVGLVFRKVQDQRSAAFLGPFSSAIAGRADFRLVTVSFLEAGKPIEAQVDALRSELEALGFDGSAGFDPDADKHALFRAFLANVGSATFFIVDRDGRLVWFQQDPRGIDVDFALALMERVGGRKE